MTRVTGRMDRRKRTSGGNQRLDGSAFAHGLLALRRDGSFVGAVLQAAGLLGRPAQEELDLRVEAAQIVVRPALDGVQHRRIDAKEKGLSVYHGAIPDPGSRTPTIGRSSRY